MKCRAIVTFTTARGEIPAGSILNIPDHLLAKLAGKVESLPLLTTPVPAEATPSALTIALPTHCQALKVLSGGGSRVCGHLLKTGPTGKKYCGDPGCWVPSDKPVLTRRGGRV